MTLRHALAAFAFGAASLVAVQPAHAAGPWREVNLPFLWPRNEVSEVAAGAPDNVWIAGVQGQVPFFAPGWSTILYTAGNPVARRWDGSRWREYPLPAFSNEGRIFDVSVHGSTTLVGGQRGTVGELYTARFTGTAFTQIPVPAEVVHTGGVHAGASGEWMYGATEGYGEARLYRYADNAWQPQQLPAGVREIRDLVSIGPNEAWAVGDRAGVGDSRYVTIRWDGTSWTSVQAPASPGRYDPLTHVVAGPGGPWAMSVAGRDDTSGVLYRWTGSAWQEVAPPAGFYEFYSDLAGNGNEVWVTSIEVAGGSTVNTVHRWTGSGWERTAVPVPSGVDKLLLRHVAAVPGSDVLWSAGRANDNRPIVMTTG